MALNVLTLRTEDGLHSVECPVGTALDVGSDPACDIVLEGEGVLPCHCVLTRTGEKSFQVTAVATEARFTVNDVTASDLGVNVPFHFGIGGEVIALDLLTAEDAAAAEAESAAGPAPVPVPEAGPAVMEDDKAATADPADPAAAARPSRRDYLLQPPVMKPRSSGRVGEVLIEPSPPRGIEPPASAPAPQPAPELSPAAAAVPLPKDGKPSSPTAASPAPVAGESKTPDEEGASFILFAGLAVCGVMIAAIIWWQQQLDDVAVAPVVSTRPALQIPGRPFSPQDALHAGRDLRLAGAPMLAAHVLMPLAEEGNAEAMLELARALHDCGEYGEEVIYLLQQAADGGLREALADWVREVDHEENPERFTAAAFRQLQTAAMRGEGTAWMPLGERHEHGNGTPQDIALALQVYAKAQAAGDARAKAKLSAEAAAVQRVEAFIRSWNEVSVATLLDHVSKTPGRFFLLEYPPMDALLRMEEELRTRWPLRRISVVAGARAEVENFDLIKVSQPFQFEVERGERLARGSGLLTCTVQRDAVGGWRVTDAADTIELTEMRPAKEKFHTAASLRELQPALTREEQVEESRLHLVQETRGLGDTQDFNPALTAVLAAALQFPQEAYWRPFADAVCDHMARQFFADGKWLDASWAEQVHQLASSGSVSAMLLEGHLLAAGYGCQRDEALSTACYQKAFEEGKRRDARFYYAEALFQGRGVAKDVPKAEALVLSFMVRSKHPLEAYLAAHLLWRKAEIDPALWQQVYDTLSRVTDKHPPAKHLAAMVLLNHGNTTRERRTGFAALKACAEAGLQEAMKNLSKCYQDGTGCEADPQAAILWKQKAAITEPPRRKHYTEWEE